jgi:hydrogenase nickel incorporation protein HypA/HybF
MHEWALAQAVIDSTLALLEKKGTNTAKEIILRIGELQNIDMQIFDFVLK